jgi:hypothetical protein
MSHLKGIESFSPIYNFVKKKNTLARTSPFHDLVQTNTFGVRYQYVA